MAFVDEITLHLCAGDGGDGVVAWLHEKGREFMGPAGGDGGKGGNVYLRTVRDIGRLSAYRHGITFVAEQGARGEGKGRHGKDGASLEVEVPVGSVVTNRVNGRTFEFLKDGERKMILRGGKGGFGNKHFKGSRNVRPLQHTEGGKGEQADFHIELRLIADAGLVGLPNAGKSSLLNILTKAHAKVGAYQFTTLEPNLGVLVDDSFPGETRVSYILADIPGLIEGASEGKGLGTKFLRHITRTGVLLHCISLEGDSPLAAYKTVRQEIVSYSPELDDKKEVVIFTKADMRSAAEIEKAIRAMKKKTVHVLAVSIIDDNLLKEFKEKLFRILKELYNQQSAKS